VSDVRVVRAADLSPNTSQTAGMKRMAAIAAETVGSRSLWAGRVTMEAGTRSGAHHHGGCESAIFLLAGRARFRFGEKLKREIEAGPGDFVYIPPEVVHQEISLDEPVDAIVVRDSQENVVVNVDLPAALVDEG
jgi:uncharacterized RmlC-like cupin family protein